MGKDQQNAPGTLITAADNPAARSASKTLAAPTPAVTIAIAKQRGSNAVWVARDVINRARQLQASVVPGNIQMVITRNYGLSANDKVNELVEGLLVAILGVVALLTISMGWREAFVVAVAVPVVFGLTLFVNLLLGFTINRVTLFALILALGLLVDDPIVDVENIVRHFAMAGKATRRIVFDAVTEIRPPLIVATLAVIVSFLPMFFITGMMGPYMRPMALNVPVAMLMSMLVAFTITPWLTFIVLRKHHQGKQSGNDQRADEPDLSKQLPPGEAGDMAQYDPHDISAVRRTRLYRVMKVLMSPLLRHRWAAWCFLGVIGLATVLATLLAATRHVPLKMLPFDNKNELLLVLDLDRGTTLERTNAAVHDFEHYLQTVPQVADFTSYVGIASPMDFNGLVRHYYLRHGDNVAEIRLHLAPRKNRRLKSHALALELRNPLTKIARRDRVKLKIVETPPGPPVIETIVAEVYGQPATSYDQLIAASRAVRARLAKEPFVVDLDDSVDAPETKWLFIPDKEKAALNHVTVDQIARTLQIALGGEQVGTIHKPDQRNPLFIELRLPRAKRSSRADLAQLRVMSSDGHLVPISELGHWQKSQADQTIYHKNLKRVVYVFANVAGRPPAGAVVDTEVDRYPYSGNPAHPFQHAPPAVTRAGFTRVGSGFVSNAAPRPLAGRTYFSNGSGIAWTVPRDIHVVWNGEGEWKITLRVFRDLGLAFAAALVGIYILLVWQTESFVIPLVVMMAIPLTIIGVMPGFWLLNLLTGQTVGGYADPVFFTATGMIGMIALAGIVTRNSIILIDFIHISLARGRSLFDAIIESAAVRLRPILLTAGAAMLGAVPITIDPIFAGLAWSLIFGLFASTLFTLFVIPVTYWLLYAHKPGHGVPEIQDDE